MPSLSDAADPGLAFSLRLTSNRGPRRVSGLGLRRGPEPIRALARADPGLGPDLNPEARAGNLNTSIHVNDI